MIYLEYVAEGKPIADARAEDYVKDMIEEENIGENGYYHISTENVIQFLLTAIAKEEISHEKVEISFNGEVVEVNKYGAIHNPPKGFMDHTQRAMTDRIMVAMKRGKADREKAKKENSSK